MKHSKSRVCKEINWRIFRMKGLASQLRVEALSNALLPQITKIQMVDLARSIETLTNKENPRLKQYREKCYEEGRVL